MTEKTAACPEETVKLVGCSEIDGAITLETEVPHVVPAQLLSKTASPTRARIATINWTRFFIGGTPVKQIFGVINDISRRRSRAGDGLRKPTARNVRAFYCDDCTLQRGETHLYARSEKGQAG